MTQTPTSSTPHQRLYLRTLMADQELPLDRVSVMHRDLFKTAGIEWRDGAHLDGELCAASRQQVARLIDAVRARA